MISPCASCNRLCPFRRRDVPGGLPWQSPSRQHCSSASCQDWDTCCDPADRGTSTHRHRSVSSGEIAYATSSASCQRHPSRRRFLVDALRQFHSRVVPRKDSRAASSAGLGVRRGSAPDRDSLQRRRDGHPTNHPGRPINRQRPAQRFSRSPRRRCADSRVVTRWPCVVDLDDHPYIRRNPTTHDPTLGPSEPSIRQWLNDRKYLPNHPYSNIQTVFPSFSDFPNPFSDGSFVYNTAAGQLRLTCESQTWGEL